MIVKGATMKTWGGPAMSVVAGVSSTIAPVVSIIAGVLASVWTGMQIYDWIQRKRGKK